MVLHLFTSLGMAGVAGLRIVDVSCDALVVLIGACAAMAAKTAENLIIGRIGMAFRTFEIGMAA